jgi:hypothetical protein
MPMTDKLIPIFAIAAVAVAAIVFANRTMNMEDRMDKMKTALSGVVNATSPAADITLQLFHTDSTVPYRARYLLIPRYLAPPVFKNDTAVVMRELNGRRQQMYRIVKALKYDTVLSVCRVDAPDSIVHVITDKRRVLLQSRDNEYCYYLTVSH